MSRRAHLHELTRQLRRYLVWQKAQGVSAAVPATPEARASLEARKEAIQRRELARLRGDRTPETGAGAPSDSTPNQRSSESTADPSPPSPVPEPPEGIRSPFGSDSGETPPVTSPSNAVTSTTPLWKKHDPIHEISGRRQKKAEKTARQTSAGGDEQKPPRGPSPPAAQRGQMTPQVVEDPETRAEKMAYLRHYLGDCTRCPLSEGRRNIVFGDGAPDASLMFVGEGPGRHEDEQGLPFVGKSGQLLTKMIKAMGFERSQVYITNVVKCRPPKNRNPAPLEIKECAPFLKKQIQVIEPEVIVTLGKFAANTLLDKDNEALGRLRGRWHEHLGVAVMPTYHPAYLLRNQGDRKFKERVWSDLKMVMNKLGIEDQKR